MVIPLGLKTGMYYAVFRWRAIPATILSCIIIAGCGVLVSLIPLFFIPAPIVIIGLATYLTSKYTTIRLFPDALVIVALVEIVSHGLIAYIVFPVIS